MNDFKVWVQDLRSAWKGGGGASASTATPEAENSSPSGEDEQPGKSEATVPVDTPSQALEGATSTERVRTVAQVSGELLRRTADGIRQYAPPLRPRPSPSFEVVDDKLDGQPFWLFPSSHANYAFLFHGDSETKCNPGAQDGLLDSTDSTCSPSGTSAVDAEAPSDRTKSAASAVLEVKRLGGKLAKRVRRCLLA